MEIIRKSRLFTVLCAAMATSSILADAPAGYYDSCEGKTGQDLLTALYNTISSHTNVGYDGLWNVYKKSDVRADGTLWDMYSTKKWSSNFTKCGNYKVVGDCVNREHSLPKSWWGGGKQTQYSDAFHLYPTDGKVNGQRSNYPFGECANGSSLAANGSVKPLGKLGSSTFSGYNGTVFEPDDQYKGDFARSYFYMAACYNNIISGWTDGNGAQMLAGNRYPVFKTWAKNLLLKWARQDQVSQKETDRNDAVYSFQHNRNPFIDHPELIEYIWGDKVGQPWYPGVASEQPDILLPVQNAAIDMGHAAVGHTRSVTVPVKTKAISGTVYIQTYGTGFSVSPRTLTAEQANEGTEITLSLLASSAGTKSATLAITADDMEREIDVTAIAVTGIPLSATEITTEGFTLNWLNLHPDNTATTYSISLRQGSQTLAGYPVTVASRDETYTVSGLEPATAYTVTLTAPDVECPEITVTTAEPVPAIDVLFDGNLVFDAEPGTPSAVAELLLDIENIADDITISVNAPFEVSTDKSAWSRFVTLSPEEDRFYLRVNSAAEGQFETSITITAGSYTADDAEAKATVADPSATTFLEDWEFDGAAELGSYSAKTFTTNVCTWSVTDGGFWPDADKSYAKSTAIRMGKDSNSTLSMAEDKTGGIGTVTFDARPYGSDGQAVVVIEYSSDKGTSWQEIKTVTFSGSEITPIMVPVNKGGAGRLRFRQTSGKRWFIDNISLPNYSELGAVNDLDYHSWDAFCRGSRLVIECRDRAAGIAVHGVDGITWVNSRFAAGTHEIDLPKGLYIVVSDDFVRRVLIK